MSKKRVNVTRAIEQRKQITSATKVPRGPVSTLTQATEMYFPVSNTVLGRAALLRRSTTGKGTARATTHRGSGFGVLLLGLAS